MNRVLLIVDDTLEVARGLRRCLKREVGTIHVASTRAEAEALMRLGPATTHILCDDDLGEGRECGSNLISLWRQEHGTIVRAGLMT